jgi:hypothetical protein
MRITEIYTADNMGLDKSSISTDDFAGYVGMAQPTSFTIKGYYVFAFITEKEKTLLLKDPESDNFLGGIILSKKPIRMGKVTTKPVWVSQSALTSELQGKGIAIELYALAIKAYQPLVVSDTEQTRGSASVWKRLNNDPELNVYTWNVAEDTYTSWDPDEETDEPVYYNREVMSQLRSEISQEYNGALKHVEELLHNKEITHARAVELYDKAEAVYVDKMEEYQKTMSNAAMTLLVVTTKDLA